MIGPAAFLTGCILARTDMLPNWNASNVVHWKTTHLGALVVMGEHNVAPIDHMVTETAIRGMYRYWREVMGV